MTARGRTRARPHPRRRRDAEPRRQTRHPPAAARPTGGAPCRIAGIGASAGGLEAFTKFFTSMPPDSGMAFVLIQHLDPTHSSLAAELLGKHTSMSVVEVQHDTRVEAGHVYVIPPNKSLGVSGGVLQLSTPIERRGMRMPVDFFLRSLAEDQKERAIGIVLSGTGTDGTLGLKEVKAAGGLTLVQDPETTNYDGMPRSALATGAVDYVLAPEQMPERLLKYVRHPYVSDAGKEAAQTERGAGDLNAILGILRAELKFDFSGYRKATLVRRIERRMGLQHIEDLARYVELLRANPAEPTALFKDLLISVSNFFRDPPAWQVLQEQVIRPLVAKKEPGETVRVWVPGCATGEEAYSLAILLVETLQGAPKNCGIQIFASDVDAAALDFARAALYPESIVADVTPERLRRFFAKGNNSYRVNKDVREAVIFAQQNLLSDPPFSRLDLISCRNLLIYLEPEVQRRVVSLLHFALADGGYLFLGSSESIGGDEDLFETVSKHWRIYRRIGATRHDKVRFPVLTVAKPPRDSTPPAAPHARLGMLLGPLLLERYVPPCVVINRKFEILQFFGATDDFLTQPCGVPTNDLIARARDGLPDKLHAAVRKAVRDNQPVAVTGARVKRRQTFHSVTVTVEPLNLAKETEGLLLVSFTDAGREAAPAVAAAPTGPSAAAARPSGDEQLVRQIEYELKTTREDLESTIEQLETSNEELKAANEEVMSVNEELQSTNEELETSKEELQSLNEELGTVNAQLQAKVGELEQTNNDVSNLLTSTELATLFLDRSFHIKRFTPSMTRLLRLISSDVGRPLSDLAAPLMVAGNLLREAETVLAQLTPLETEVRSEEGRDYVRRVLPYRTQDNRIDGVVVTFTDITDRKRAEAVLQGFNEQLEREVAERTEALRKSAVHLRAIVDAAADGIVTIDEQGTVQSFNRAAEQMFAYPAAEVIGQNIRTLMPAPFRDEHDGYLARYRDTGEAHIIGVGREVVGRRKDGTTFPMDLSVSDVRNRVGFRFVGIVRDISERKRAQEEAARHHAELARVLRFSTLGALAGGLAHELNQPLSAIANSLEACRTYLEQGKAEPKRIRDLLGHASTQALHAGSIVSHLREMIQKREPRLEVVDLSDLVRSVNGLLQHELTEQHITPRLQLAEHPLPVRADRIELEQVLLNLLQNAIDAMCETATRRELSVRTSRGKGGTAEVTVRDTGPGLSPEATARLFEPFFSTKAQGVGMGLAICRSIIEAHRGRLWLEPTPPGEGAEVRIRLPLADERSARRRARDG